LIGINSHVDQPPNHGWFTIQKRLTQEHARVPREPPQIVTPVKQQIDQLPYRLIEDQRTHCCPTLIILSVRISTGIYKRVYDSNLILVWVLGHRIHQMSATVSVCSVGVDAVLEQAVDAIDFRNRSPAPEPCAGPWEIQE
jgi:hypothetical protein